MPGLPIVLAIGYPTQKIKSKSKFIDLHVRPHVENLPSYLKHTPYHLNKTLFSNKPADTILVTMDFTSLYTNIPHNEGIAVCKEV